jgi:hypothetical protein
MAQKRKRQLTADRKQASRGPTQKSHKKGKPRNVHGEWLPQTRTEIKAAHQIKTEKEERKRLKKARRERDRRTKVHDKFEESLASYNTYRFSKACGRSIKMRMTSIS